MPKSKAPGPAEPDDPAAVAAEMREKLEAAKRRMAEYRDEMEASGLALTHEADDTTPSV